MNGPDVTDTELEVLRLLWERRKATIRELATSLYPDGGASGYATVQKLLERLEAKGYVARDRRKSTHRFSPAIDRDALVGRRLHAVAESLCDGSLVPLLSHLVRHSKPLSTSDQLALRDLIERLDGQTPSKPIPKRSKRGNTPRS